MIILYIALIIFVIFALDSIFVIIVHWRVLGKFDVVSDWQRMLIFESNTGTFKSRDDLQQLEYAMNDIRGTIAFKDIEQLELSVIPRDAGWLEFLLDMDMDESWVRERDYVDWHTVSIVLAGGEKIPLFRSGEYHRIKYFHEFYTEAQLSLLRSLGWLVDVQKQSREVLDELRARTGHPRVNYLRDMRD